MRDKFGVDIKIDRSRGVYARRRRSSGGGWLAFIVLFGALIGGGYLLLQMRLGGGPSFALRSATPSPTIPVTPTRSFDDFVKQGAESELAGNYRRAIELYDQASRRRPNDPDLHRRVARLLILLNDPAKGELRARKALEIDTNHAPSRATLCMALEWQKRFDEAERECATALQLDPKLVEAHAYYAELQADREDLDGALKSAQEALDLDAANTDALRAMGYVYYVFGRYDTALNYYDRALAVNPNLPVVLVGKAKIYNTWAVAGANAGVIYANADAAIEALRAAIAIDEKNVEAYERLGEAYRIRGEFGKSSQVFDTAAKLDPSRISVYTRRGVLRFQQYAFLQAIEDYTTAISLSKALSQTISATDYTFLGYAQQLAGQCDAARVTMSDAMTLYPENGYLSASAQEIDQRCVGK